MRRRLSEIPAMVPPGMLDFGVISAYHYHLSKSVRSADEEDDGHSPERRMVKQIEKALILYVDDEPSALEALKGSLVDRGFGVLTAANGADALAILKSKSPDLIIVDLRMQPMNGFALFQAVKKNPRFRKTPVIILTAVDDPIAQKYGETLGVDGYLTKPVDADNLDSIIRAKLGLP